MTLPASAVGNLVEHNVLVANARHGYWDLGGANTANANIAIANGYLDGVSDGTGSGINVTGAFFAGADNVARGNDGDQCFPDSMCA